MKIELTEPQYRLIAERKAIQEAARAELAAAHKLCAMAENALNAVVTCIAADKGVTGELENKMTLTKDTDGRLMLTLFPALKPANGAGAPT